ncbi:hypothetical protein IGV22_004540, partial [Salmonella enterica subsp. enterica serovar Heidelberg]|nr:hypothetical protein [Salmonella enterica subsp. enterica serovar Heidelberg]
MQYTDIQIWQPGILRNTDYLNPGPAKLLAATLDKDIKIFKEGGRSARIMALALF